MGTTLFNLSELIYLGNRSYLLIHERTLGKICEMKRNYNVSDPEINL